tara:strand:- start:839 stop:1084 length:246 start_codon:yes stop_codon:yes gene_type:complete
MHETDIEIEFREPLREILEEYFSKCDQLNIDPLASAIMLNKEVLRYILDEYNIEWYIYCGALQLMCSEPDVRAMISKRRIN